LEIERRPWSGDLPRSFDLLLIAASVGLLTGLVEGAALRYLQNSRWAGETINCLLVPRGILYVSPLTDLLLFVVLGFLGAGICRISRGRVPGKFLLFLLSLMAVFDWLALALDGVMDPPAIAVLSAGISAGLSRRYWKDRARLAIAARRLFPVLAAILILVSAGVRVTGRRAEAAAATGMPPAPVDSANVLVIVMDTVRADHLSALGYSRPTTPNLDNLASQGVLFENAFSTSCWTLPAHASLLTGRYPFEHGAEVKSYDGRYPTLAEAFRQRGYRTGAFSANTYYFARQNGFGRGFLHFDGMFTNLPDALMRTMYGRNLMMLYQQNSRSDLPGRKRAEVVNAHFLRWLQEEPSRPFFAVLNYFDAHDPYLPPNPFRGKFADRPDVGGLLNGWGEREALEVPSELGEETDAYDGGIAYEDARIGRLMDELQRRGLAENTLLVVVSDHGEFFGEHSLYLHKNALFMEGIHVPLVVVWPHHVPAGVRVRVPVSTVRVPATVMALLPGPGQAEFPGSSLATLWSGPSATGEDALVLSELVAHAPLSDGGDFLRTESLLNSRWHFIYTRGKAPLLFEWRKDPREKQNLAETKYGQSIVSAMMSCLEDHLPRIRQPGCGFTAGVFDAETRAALPANRDGGAESAVETSAASLATASTEP
jgi:arylsulfatase A-like enzyme